MALRLALLAVPLALVGAWIGLPLPGAGRRRRARLLGALAGAGAAAVLTMVVPEGILAYLVSFAVSGGIFALLALGLNVHWGYTGLFNVGVAGFFAVGAFSAALFTTAMPEGPLALYSRQAFGLEWPFLGGVVAAVVVCGCVAYLVGLPTLRLKDEYFAVASIGMAEVIRLVFQNERWLANGPQPLRGIPRPLHCLVEEPTCPWLPAGMARLVQALEPRDYPYVYLLIVSLFVAAAYVAIERAIRSPWGRVLRAIRDEEAAAAMSGKDVRRFKMQALVVGAGIMGAGGALYAHYMSSIDYGHFTPLYGTFLIWVMVMLGGSGNNRGAILGAFVVWGVWAGTAFLSDWVAPALGAIAPELPARAPYLRYLAVALLLEAVLLWRPEGLLGEERHVSIFLEMERPARVPGREAAPTAGGSR
ncbi:branched-chain amino acid ABC transporter permease [Carboxydochorda subterranea]|uniref:Branched-chain amino acid ABC transporter permease n=1 Tax=Carboxydichorda subterranea TaxID=3109565 RepID=A0ABZ1C0T6_9FIRM|nr:branched-chain amino acid ABC transporter permease [Limnochorda sp. L945t]WRP17923.1 branched-chain amino acid ABC transporter permease [Limnochorda sp. L945t]